MNILKHFLPLKLNKQTKERSESTKFCLNIETIPHHSDVVKTAQKPIAIVVRLNAEQLFCFVKWKKCIQNCQQIDSYQNAQTKLVLLSESTMRDTNMTTISYGVHCGVHQRDMFQLNCQFCIIFKIMKRKRKLCVTYLS